MTPRYEALKDNTPLPPAVPEPVEVPPPLDASQISAMLEKKKKELAERKEQLEKLRKQTMIVAQPVVQTSEFVLPIQQQEDTMPPPSLEEQQALMNEAIEKARKAAYLHNRIQSKVLSGYNINNWLFCIINLLIYLSNFSD